MRRQDRQGFVLVLAMLVLLVLSGLGAYALRTSRVDLRATGNVRIGAQAEYVAESALHLAIAQIIANPSVIVSNMTNSADGKFTISHSNAIFQENVTGFDAFGVGAGVVPQFNVVLSRGIDMSPGVLPGYMIGSVGGTTARIRLKRVDVMGNGLVVPKTGSTTEHRTAAAQVRAQMVIGPL